jgi:hypothetical protein
MHNQRLHNVQCLGRVLLAGTPYQCLRHSYAVGCDSLGAVLLAGFNEEAEDGDTFAFKPQPKPSPTAAGSAARKNSRFAASPTTAAAAAAADETKPWEARSPEPGSRRVSEASSKALAAAAAATDGAGAEDDGDISPMSLSPSVSAYC